MTAIANARRLIVALCGSLMFSAPADAADDPYKESARLYDTYCAQCHGVQRNGKGVNTIGLSVQPKDHTDPAGMGSLPREQIVRAIREGGAGVNKSALMPPWGAILTEKQIEDMASYLFKVCNCGKAN